MSSNDKPNILVFMSDQHNARVMETYDGSQVNTPNLKRLAGEGTDFRNAYTSCPLCVPARASMLTGQLPSKTGIFTNGGVINSEQATFVHSLAASGYVTVLCGRMHFLGPDQFHGFTRRLVGDFTPSYHGRYGPSRKDLGPYVGTPAGDFAKLYGGGTSPVLEYDRAVVEAAIDYLAQPHDRPVFLLVGTYGPHHTFVAPKDLYRKYLDILGPTNSDSQSHFDLHPALQNKSPSLDPDVIRCLRAAYYGLVEHTDIQFGRVREAWKNFVSRNNQPNLCCYLSDHGEHAGEKGLWGKNTFYEESVRIPLIFAGSDVQRGTTIQSPCSIMDLGPTLCELAAAKIPPEQDGKSLVSALKTQHESQKRFVISEMIGKKGPARMVRRENWKYISHSGMPDQDQLFDLDRDEYEYQNCINEHPDVARELKEVLNQGWEPAKIVADQKRRKAHFAILSQWGEATDVPEPYRWKIPESAWELPEP